jgi:hypothetical protein
VNEDATVNNGERKIDEPLETHEPPSRSQEEQRLTFYRLIKTVSDAIEAEGAKARAQRTSRGQANKRSLEAFERHVLTATLALGGNGELAAITADMNAGAEKPSSDTGVFFALSRLEGEGFIASKYVRATETEKAKVLFKVTDEGEDVLAETDLA